MSVTALYFPYKAEFEPIVRIEENIAIPVGAGKLNFFKVQYIEPVQPIIPLVSLTSLQRNVEKVLTEIKLEENEAGQWRLWIPDYVAVKMKYPRGTGKWVTKETETSALPLSMAKQQILEFYTWKDDVPILYLDNPLAEDQDARLILWGLKYSLTPLAEKPKDYTVLPAYSAAYVVGAMGR